MENNNACDALDAKAALESLQDYVAMSPAVKLREKAGGTLKAWLSAHPGEELYDEGSKHRAGLAVRRGASTYDVASMPDGLVLWAARHGLLQVDAKVLDALSDKFAEVADIKKQAIPGGESTTLRVTKESSDGT